MKRWGLGLLCVWMLSVPVAEAGELQEGVAKVGGVAKAILVSTDKVLHWTEAVLHQRVIHPIVLVATFGTVDLSTP